MDCKHIREALPEFVVGALGASAVEDVRQHLAACAECAREREALLATGELLASAPPFEPPRELWSALAPRLRPRRKRRAGWLSAFVLRPSTGLGAAACIALLIVAAMSFLPARPPAGGPPVGVSLAEDEDAALFARWGVQADLASGMADPYAAVVALAGLPTPQDETDSP